VPRVATRESRAKISPGAPVARESGRDCRRILTDALEATGLRCAGLVAGEVHAPTAYVATMFERCAKVSAQANSPRGITDKYGQLLTAPILNGTVMLFLEAVSRRDNDDNPSLSQETRSGIVVG
jgi:hypothetical protein